MSDGPTQVATVCAQNAGRSEVAHAFAERDVDRRGVGDRISFVSGGTDPATAIHPVVGDVMAEVEARVRALLDEFQVSTRV